MATTKRRSATRRAKPVQKRAGRRTRRRRRGGRQFVDVVTMNLLPLAPPPNPADVNERPDDFAGLLPPGVYDFEVAKVALGTSRAGHNTLKITGRVVSEGLMHGRHMTNGYIVDSSDHARGRMLQFVQATCTPLNADGSFSREGLIGRRFSAEVFHDVLPGRVVYGWRCEKALISLTFEEQLLRMSPVQRERLMMAAEYAANQHMEAAQAEMERANLIRSMLNEPIVR